MNKLKEIEKEIEDKIDEARAKTPTSATYEYKIDMKGFMRGLHVALSIVRNKQ